MSCLRCGGPLPNNHPLRKTCSAACRVGRIREGMDGGRLSRSEASRLLGITVRELSYWLKMYIPPSRERVWGRPALTFRDLFWLAYIAESKASGFSTRQAASRMLRALSLRKSWRGAPLRQLVLYHSADTILITKEMHAVAMPRPVVRVDGPALRQALKDARRDWTGRGKSCSRSSSDAAPSRAASSRESV